MTLPAHDPLLAAVAWLCAEAGRPRSPESLLAERGPRLPLGADDALLMLRDNGFEAGLLERDLVDVHPLLLPVVLLAPGGGACVLTARTDGPDGPVFEVLEPAAGLHRRVGAADLVGQYSGALIAAAPRPDERAARARAAHDDDLRDQAHWLWSTLRRFVPYYRASMLAATLSNVLMLATAVITAVVFDRVIPHQAFVTLWALAVGGAVAVAFDLAARQLRSHLIDTAGKKADLLIGSALFRRTLALRMEFRPASAGAHSHHLAQIETVRDFVASASLSALTDLPFVVLFVAASFMIGGALGWVLVLAIPVVVGIALLAQRTLRASMRAQMRNQADLQGLLVESVEGLEDLKVAGAGGHFARRFDEATMAAAEAALRARRASSLASNVSAVAQQAITLVILVWGVHLIHDGQLSPGALIACVMLGARGLAPLSTVVSLATRFQGARVALGALDRLMALPVENPDREARPCEALQGRIALRDVAFAYPGRDGRAAPPVLRGLDLRIEAGERVVMIGRIGSGKSTVLRLMAGLYQPTQGLVEVDGIDLRQIDPVDYRARIGFVTQEPRLFDGTLRENIALGRAWVDNARLAEVAALTGLDALIAAHPAGWDMPVGEMGCLLSGGQRQLVALARALVARPRLLLMDEPTSSMDAQSELVFVRRLATVAADSTLVMVTHRPALLELATRVCVLDGGRLVADGPRDAVLSALRGRTPGATAGAAPPAPTAAEHVRAPEAAPDETEAQPS